VKKLRVGVIYGGRSGEHEVSIASAAASQGLFTQLGAKEKGHVPYRGLDGRRCSV